MEGKSDWGKGESVAGILVLLDRRIGEETAPCEMTHISSALMHTVHELYVAISIIRHCT